MYVCQYVKFQVAISTLSSGNYKIVVAIGSRSTVTIEPCIATTLMLLIRK